MTSGVNITPESDSSGNLYGPDMFYSDLTLPDPTTVVNEPLPRAWSQGGVIESVKRAVVTGLRQGFANATLGLSSDDSKFYIEIEYPTDVEKYPGIWVQFQIEDMKRAGLGMETWVKDDNQDWVAIQAWMFTGRISCTIAALSAKDRDRLADAVIAQLAFSRPPDLVIRDPRKDSKQFRGLITAIDNNPYVQMTLNNDIIHPGGAQVTNSVPWAQNVLLYEDTYAIECVGQFNLRYAPDGTYTLAEIRGDPHMLADNVAYDPTQWRGVMPSR